MGPAKLSWKNVSGSNSRPFSSDAPCTKTQRLRKITNQSQTISGIKPPAVRNHSTTYSRGSGQNRSRASQDRGIVPHDSHRAIAQLGSRAKVQVDRDLDGGGPGPGSSDNLTLDLVSAAAVNAPSLINKMTRSRYWPHCLLMACAVKRRRFPVGASPTRQPLQPEAIGAVTEVTKWLKPSISVSRIGDSASVQAATRVNAEQASKRTMRRPTRLPFRGRLIRLGE